MDSRNLIVFVGLFCLIKGQGSFTCRNDMDYNLTKISTSNVPNSERELQLVWYHLFNTDDDDLKKKCIKMVTFWYGGRPNSTCCDAKDGWKMLQKEPSKDLLPFLFETCRSRLSGYIKVENYEDSFSKKWTEPQFIGLNSTNPITRCYEDVPLAKDTRLTDTMCNWIFVGLSAVWLLAFISQFICCCFLCKQEEKDNAKV